MKSLILDFDGTLADTQRCIVATMKATLETLHLPPADEEAITKVIGLPLRENFTEDPKVLENLRKRIRSGALFSDEQDPQIEKVVIRFPGYAKNFLRERPYHTSMKVREQENGELHVTMNVAINDMLKQWVLFYGPIAEVLKPAKLRRMMLDSAKELVWMYEKGEVKWTKM